MDTFFKVLGKSIKAWGRFLMIPFKGVPSLYTNISQIKNDNYKVGKEAEESDVIQKLREVIFTVMKSEIALNHTVEEGKNRISLLFEYENSREIVNEVVADVLICTTKLDSDLYTPETIEKITELATKRPVHILYRVDSNTIRKLKEEFNKPNSQGKIFPIQSDDSNSEISNFILTTRCYSEETLQTYDDNNKLINHQATFYYNYHLDLNVLEDQVKEKIKCFKNQWKELNLS